jgi:hypothetical protein
VLVVSYDTADWSEVWTLTRPSRGSHTARVMNVV